MQLGPTATALAIGPTATATNCNWDQLQLRMRPTATGTNCNRDQLQLWLGDVMATCHRDDCALGPGRPAALSDPLCGPDPGPAKLPEPTRRARVIFLFLFATWRSDPMPLDEGPRISWSAFILSFFVVLTTSAISEPSSDKDVSSGTLLCMLS